MKTKDRLTDVEKIRIYLEHHADEVFTPDFMEELADRFLNINTIRTTFKRIYPRILHEEIIPNAEIMPVEYEEQQEKNNRQKS